MTDSTGEFTNEQLRVAAAYAAERDRRVAVELFRKRCDLLITGDDGRDGSALLEQLNDLLGTKGASNAKRDCVGPITIVVGTKYFAQEDPTYRFGEEYWLERQVRNITVADTRLRLTFRRGPGRMLRDRGWYLVETMKLTGDERMRPRSHSATPRISQI